MCGHSLTLKVCKLFALLHRSPMPQIQIVSEEHCWGFWAWAVLEHWGCREEQHQEGFHSPDLSPSVSCLEVKGPTWLLSGQAQRSFSPSTLELPGYFLSVSMSVSRATAKCFPTLPLPLLPFQRRGKYCAHTFHEYSLNDWMFVWGDQLHHPVLWGFVAVIVFPLWLHFFPCSPLFAGDTAH